MNPIEFEAVIWDIDDVLINTRLWHKRSQIAALNILGIEQTLLPRFLSLWDRLFWFFDQNNYENIICALLWNSEYSHLLKDTRLVNNAVSAALAIWSEPIPLNDSISNILKLLSNSKVPQGIVSNGNIELQIWKLSVNNILEYITPDAIVIVDPLSKNAKPSPLPIITCCKKLNVIPRKTLCIGDRASDVISANLAGAISIRINLPSFEKKEPTDLGAIEIEKPHFLIENTSQVYTWFVDQLSTTP